VAIVVIVALVIAAGVIALVVSLGGDDKDDTAIKPTVTGSTGDSTRNATQSSSPEESTPEETEPETTAPPSDPPTTTASTPYPTDSSGSVPVQKVPLSPGDCIVFASVGTGIDKISCTSPHDAEHIRNVQLPAGAWPGDAAMDARASDTCEPIAAPVINRQSQASELTWLYIYPKETGWTAGDRQVQCLVSYTDDTKKLSSPLS